MATSTAKELAQKLDTDGRTVRKFLRSITPKDDQPGKGSRWVIENKDIRSMKSKFSKFQADQEAARIAREAAAAAEEVETTEDEVEVEETD